VIQIPLEQIYSCDITAVNESKKNHPSRRKRPVALIAVSLTKCQNPTRRRFQTLENFLPGGSRHEGMLIQLDDI
jgi:hypothetical protein